VVRRLAYAGYIGGINNDWGTGIAVDVTGTAFVTGWTLSDQVTFPDLIGPDLSFNGDRDAYVAKVHASVYGLGLCRLHRRQR